MNTDPGSSVFMWFHFVQFMQMKILASLRRIFGVVPRISPQSEIRN